MRVTRSRIAALVGLAVMVLTACGGGSQFWGPKIMVQFRP